MLNAERSMPIALQYHLAKLKPQLCDYIHFL